MSISINYSSTIGLHGIDPVITSKHLIEWITSYNDITVTGKTNFNNDIKLSYDSLNFLNINIDENANTIFNIIRHIKCIPSFAGRLNKLSHPRVHCMWHAPPLG